MRSQYARNLDAREPIIYKLVDVLVKNDGRSISCTPYFFISAKKVSEDAEEENFNSDSRIVALEIFEDVAGTIEKWGKIFVPW